MLTNVLRKLSRTQAASEKSRSEARYGGQKLADEGVANIAGGFIWDIPPPPVAPKPKLPQMP